jgi:hypothetical protein
LIVLDSVGKNDTNLNSEFMSPELRCKRGSKTTTNRKSNFFVPDHSHGKGSENAPDESGFLSSDEEGMCKQRIVNESSLRNEEEDEGEDYDDLRDEDFEASGGPLLTGEQAYFLTVS